MRQDFARAVTSGLFVGGGTFGAGGFVGTWGILSHAMCVGDGDDIFVSGLLSSWRGEERVLVFLHNWRAVLRTSLMPDAKDNVRG